MESKSQPICTLVHAHIQHWLHKNLVLLKPHPMSTFMHMCTKILIAQKLCIALASHYGLGSASHGPYFHEARPLRLYPTLKQPMELIRCVLKSSKKWFYIHKHSLVHIMNWNEYSQPIQQTVAWDVCNCATQLLITQTCEEVWHFPLDQLPLLYPHFGSITWMGLGAYPIEWTHDMLLDQLESSNASDTHLDPDQNLTPSMMDERPKHVADSVESVGLWDSFDLQTHDVFKLCHTNAYVHLELNSWIETS